MKQVFVEIIELATSDVIRRMGPMSERKANQVEMGAMRNMDLENFSTRQVPAEERKET